MRIAQLMNHAFENIFCAIDKFEPYNIGYHMSLYNVAGAELYEYENSVVDQ